MKEFSSQTGGRYTYADDLENLQDLALAFAQIFDDCDNFIVSGCEVSGSNISAGYVYINGKLRYFSGATGLAWPQYIYENNLTEDVPYESGSNKIGRNNYSCEIADAVPVKLDKLTGKLPKAIAITATGGLRMKDAFFGKYALILDPETGTQTVKGAVNFQGNFQANGTITALQPVVIKSGTLRTTMSYNGSAFTLLSTGGSTQYKIIIDDQEGFKFYVGDALKATIDSSGVVLNSIQSSRAEFGDLVLENSHLYQNSANGLSTVYINFKGYHGAYEQYRNLYIGDGKGNSVLSVFGVNKTVSISGRTTITSHPFDGLVLRASVLKTDPTMMNAIAWQDASSSVLARLGFTNTSGQSFCIYCPLYPVHIVGSDVVNIGPSIAEGGVLLSERYVSKDELTAALSLKADNSAVYAQSQANAIFAFKTGGLKQFVNTTNTADVCRQQIGAIGTSELSSYAKLSNCLSDMATSEYTKQLIRDNIGAVGQGEYQYTLKDTGWILIKDSLYVRQFGNIVCVQGTTRTVHSGTVFTLPNAIDVPMHPVKHTIAFSNNLSWVCKIAAGQRDCTVVYCDSGCNKNTEFSITYMV